MATRNVRVDTSLPGWPYGTILAVDDANPFIAALIAANRLVDYTPPAGGSVPVDHNAVVRVFDLETADSAALAALRAIFLTGSGVTDVKVMAKAAYDALPTKAGTTLYLTY